MCNSENRLKGLTFPQNVLDTRQSFSAYAQVGVYLKEMEFENRLGKMTDAVFEYPFAIQVHQNSPQNSIRLLPVPLRNEGVYKLDVL